MASREARATLLITYRPRALSPRIRPPGVKGRACGSQFELRLRHDVDGSGIAAMCSNSDEPTIHHGRNMVRIVRDCYTTFLGAGTITRVSTTTGYVVVSCCNAVVSAAARCIDFSQSALIQAGVQPSGFDAPQQRIELPRKPRES
jgi:hypothetical protein